jgi:hypothetical protein
MRVLPNEVSGGMLVGNMKKEMLAWVTKQPTLEDKGSDFLLVGLYRSQIGSKK